VEQDYDIVLLNAMCERPVTVMRPLFVSRTGLDQFFRDSLNGWKIGKIVGLHLYGFLLHEIYKYYYKIVVLIDR
jgi:hypothetical protein